MNKVVEIGRLTKDPELRYTQSNTPVCGFTIAVDRFVKAGEEKQADFFPVVAWNKCAEFCSKYFAKGRKVVIFGRLQNRNWEDDKGVKHYVTEIVAEEVDFADSKKDDGATPAGQQNQQKPPEQKPPQDQTPPAQNNGQPAWAQGQQQGQPAGSFPWQQPK